MVDCPAERAARRDSAEPTWLLKLTTLPRVVALLLLGTALLTGACGDGQGGVPSASPSPSAIATPRPSPFLSPTPSPEATAMPTEAPPTITPRVCGTLPNRGSPAPGSLEEQRLLQATAHLQNMDQGAFTASTGETISIGLMVGESGFVNFIVYPLQKVLDPTPDEQLTKRMQTFREAASSLFTWISNQGICISDIYGY